MVLLRLCTYFASSGRRGAHAWEGYLIDWALPQRSGIFTYMIPTCHGPLYKGPVALHAPYTVANISMTLDFACPRFTLLSRCCRDSDRFPRAGINPCSLV